MHAPRLCAMLAILGFAMLSQTAIGQSAAISSDQLTELLLARTQERLASITNYRCTQVIPQPQNPTIQERRTLSIDHLGRGCVRISSGRNALTCICDGTKTIELRSEIQPDGSVANSVSIVAGMQHLLQQYNDPWFYMGGMLADELAEIRNKGGRTHTSTTSAGHYRIDLRDKAGRTQVITIDPNQGYVPIERRIYVGGTLQSEETATFKEIQPGIWFPEEVHLKSQSSANGQGLQESALKYQFTGVAINDGDFERVFVARFSRGTEVYDRTRGEYYIVGTDTIRPLEGTANAGVETSPWTTLSGTGDEPWRKAFDAVYHLKSNEILKYVGPPFIQERIRYLASIEPNLDRQTDRVVQNRLYVFQWDEASSSTQRLSDDRTIELATVLEHVVQLGSYEYEGPAHLLRLRLAGDWIVRNNTSAEQRLRALEQIVEEETRRPITFVKQQAQDIVVRVSGTYRFSPLPQAPDQDNVFIAAGQWDLRQSSAMSGIQRGTMANLLHRVGNAVGVRIIDDTGSSHEELCWLMHESSELRNIRNARSLYNAKLGALLNNLASQTGLTFKPEIGTLDVWRVTTRPSLASQGK